MPALLPFSIKYKYLVAPNLQLLNGLYSMQILKKSISEQVRLALRGSSLFCQLLQYMKMCMCYNATPQSEAVTFVLQLMRM